MLSDNERRAIEKALAPLPSPRAGILEALRVVQEGRGWVSDEAVRDVAGLLGLTPDEVDGVATFYSLVFRRPVGRHVILVCDNISCWVLGYQEILVRLRSGLGIGFGQTTSDSRFTLLPVACLGACDRAPVIMVDSDLYGEVTPDGLEAILGKYE